MISYSKTAEVSESISGYWYARVAFEKEGKESQSVFVKFDKEPSKENIEAQAAIIQEKLNLLSAKTPCECLPCVCVAEVT